MGGDRIADGRVRASFVRSFVPSRASFSTAHPPPPTPSTHIGALPWLHHRTCACCQRCMVSMLAICPNSLLFVSSTAPTRAPHCHPFCPSCEAQTTKVGQPVITSSLGSKDPNNLWAVIIVEASSFKLLFRYDCKIWRFSFSFEILIANAPPAIVLFHIST